MHTFQETPPSPVGRLEYAVRRDGELIETVSDPNVIVELSRQIHAKLLGGAANQSVTRIGFGTSGAAASAGNTVLTNAFVKAIDSVTYPAANKVQFNFSLLSGEANGKLLMEFGLLTEGGVLYARRVRTTALSKETDVSLSGSWVITF
jgi:hypothetical protein